MNTATLATATESHYFGSSAFNWATGETRREVLQKLAKAAGANVIKENVKHNGGLYAWTVRVDAPANVAYEIDCYKPVGVPIADVKEFDIQNITGAAFPRD